MTFWSFSQLLPETLSSFFNAFVVSYLQRPLQYRGEILNSIQGQGNEEELLVLRETEFVRRFIHNDLAPELIRNVLFGPSLDKISSFLTQSDPALHEFPAEIAHYYRVTNPLLDFVKLICLVVKLDKAVEQEAIILRRQLLKNMRVKEFAPEAQFTDPYNSFIIPAVFCSYCNDNRNLDICSDPDLQQSVHVGRVTEDIGKGECVGLSKLSTCVRHACD